MRLLVAEDYGGLSARGADFLLSTLGEEPGLSVVLATGETPMGVYRELAARRGQLETSRLRVFQLDEYLGLAPGDKRSLYGWTKRAVLDPLGIPAHNTVRLPGETSDPDGACRRYADRVGEAGGFDLAVLGLGPNGHLGFNEPPSGPDSSTRAVELADESVESNARYWGGRERVPRRAMTAGMDILLSARRILLVVSGAHKRAVLHRVLEGPASPEVPASYLRLARDVTVLADRAALGAPPPDFGS